MKEYFQISGTTLAVIPISKYKTKIIEKDNEYIINENAFQIMDYNCRYYGSTYEGRTKGTKTIIGCEYKLPIIIEESQNIIFFPTSSPYSEDCCWISFNNIDRCELNGDKMKIIFKNNIKLDINLSKRIIDSQIYRTSLLVHKLNERKIRTI